jgi:hypothetical protein
MRLVRCQRGGEGVGSGQGDAMGTGRGLGVSGDDGNPHGVYLRFAWTGSASVTTIRSAE